MTYDVMTARDPNFVHCSRLVFVLYVDFDGFPINYAESLSLPVHLGLHHHGEQPDLAGYTLKEIFLLCRSTIPAQRVINLKLLGNIIFNSR